MRRVAYYEHHTGKLTKPLTLAVVSDLHNEDYQDIFPLIEGADALLVPGDISDRYHEKWKNGIFDLVVGDLFKLAESQNCLSEVKELITVIMGQN